MSENAFGIFSIFVKIAINAITIKRSDINGTSIEATLPIRLIPPMITTAVITATITPTINLTVSVL